MYIYIYINVCAGFEGADEGVLPRTWRESSRGVQGSCQRLPRGSQGLFRTYTRTKEENKNPFCRKSTCLCMCVSVDLLLSHTEIVCACLLTSCVSLYAGRQGLRVLRQWHKWYCQRRRQSPRTHMSNGGKRTRSWVNERQNRCMIVHRSVYCIVCVRA